MYSFLEPPKGGPNLVNGNENSKPTNVPPDFRSLYIFWTYCVLNLGGKAQKKVCSTMRSNWPEYLKKSLWIRLDSGKFGTGLRSFSSINCVSKGIDIVVGRMVN